MPDEILTLAQDFPPVPTSAWEAAIRVDLKGADYEKKLVWRTEEGLSVRPYYRREDLARDARPLPVAAKEGAAPAATAIHADAWHEAGAHAVQELAFALAAGVERLAEDPAQEIAFVFGVGSEYFVEIAKFRAARLLWASVTEAFGVAAPLRVWARTGRYNKSLDDPYTNLLRVTTEALSALIGGCGEVEVTPVGFDAHLAVNVPRILREEAHVCEVEDPAAGSYYIETLTDALARAAWKLFQEIEAAGGYSKAVESGAIESALAQTRAVREKAVSSRRRTLVGVNNYPDLTQQAPAGAAFEDGYRLALPFEKIRARTARGRRPKVLLLTRGDVKMRGARANFALNFFGCAGLAVEQSGEYVGTDADLIVLCSSDAEYQVLAHEVGATVRVPVIVAGNPKDQIDALKQAGVAGFVHVGSDAIETLSYWQDRLGMEA